MAILAIFTFIIFNSPLNPDPVIADLGDDYIEDFEAGISPSWDVTGFWHIEDNRTSLWPLYDDIPSGDHYAWYGNSTSGHYDTGDDWNSGDLVTDSVDLTGLTEPIELGFWSKSKTDMLEGTDIKTVFISTDGGTSWKEIAQLPDDDAWKYWAFDITDFISNNVRIRFSFDTVDARDNYFPGWMIDDIRIGKPLERFDLWIKQDNHAYIGDVKVMEFFATSFYDHSTYMNISIDILTPSSEMQNLYSAYHVLIGAYMGWENALEYQFNEAGNYWVYFSLTNATGIEEWAVECGWNVEEDVFALWIDQDNHAFQYEMRPMYFHAQSYYNEGMSVNVTAYVEKPMGGTEILFDEHFVWFDAFGSWDKQWDYEFNEIGTYKVNFFLYDKYGIQWHVDCWWDIEGPKENMFDLWIEQDYKAGVTDNKKMGFFIDSYFNIPKNVNINITMETPSESQVLYSKDSVPIEAYGYWEDWVDYTFNEAGEYYVYFYVTDSETSEEWMIDCWWEVDKDFFDLEIIQDCEAGVTDWRMMSFNTKSYYDHGLWINVSIDIINSSGLFENLYSENFIYINAYESWDYSLEYLFKEVGEYTVIFSIVDEYGKGWARECPWYVKDNFIGTWMGEETCQYAQIGETRWLKFFAKSYYSFEMSVDIVIEIETPNGYIETLHWEEGSIINPYDTWEAPPIEYTFTETGGYGILFIVTDEYGYEWIAECWLKVEHSYFELKIDQDRYADVGDEKRMTFMVKSYFSHGMDVEIKATIETPSGTEELLFHENVWIEAYDSWEGSIRYEFKEIGEYYVYFVLTDDIGVKWTEDCEWDISEPSTETTDETGEPTISVTPGFESFLIISAIVSLAIYYKKRLI